MSERYRFGVRDDTISATKRPSNGGRMSSHLCRAAISRKSLGPYFFPGVMIGLSTPSLLTGGRVSRAAPARIERQLKTESDAHGIPRVRGRDAQRHVLHLRHIMPIVTDAHDHRAPRAQGILHLSSAE